MANIYWIKGGADAHWDTWDGNWFDDLDGTTGAGHVPQDGDFAYLTGATAPDNGPAVPVELIGLDTSALADDVTITSDVTATETVVLGGRGTADVHTWNGATSAGIKMKLQGGAVVAGTTVEGTLTLMDNVNVSGIALFVGITELNMHDSATATGIVMTGATVRVYGNNTISNADEDLTITGANIYIYGRLTINNTGANILTGVPTIHLMNRIAQFIPVGSVTANVIPYRFATAKRLRRIS